MLNNDGSALDLKFANGGDPNHAKEEKPQGKSRPDAEVSDSPNDRWEGLSISLFDIVRAKSRGIVGKRVGRRTTVQPLACSQKAG